MKRQKSNFHSISSVIDQLIKKIKPPADSWIDIIKENWEKIVGEDVAKNTKIVRIQESTLFVKVENHIWKSELNGGLGKVILKRLQKEISNDIKKISWY